VDVAEKPKISGRFGGAVDIAEKAKISGKFSGRVDIAEKARMLIAGNTLEPTPEETN